MTAEYLIGNRADQEPKFYPCKMCIIIKGKDRTVILAPSLFESREQYLDFKRGAVQACMHKEFTKQKRLQLYWDLLIGIQGNFDEDKLCDIEILGLFIGPSRVNIKGEDFDSCNYWTKIRNLDDVEADGMTVSRCFGCNIKKKLEELSKCAGCKHACYCNRECQKKHWKIHKKKCF